MTPQELKNSILQLAIQGKLVEQRPEEGTAAELLEKGFLTTSCCPAFVEYIHVKFPELDKYVSHTLSPMAYTGKAIKEADPNAVVVFIGPCMAKKYERKKDCSKDYIDHVLTFFELQALFDSKDIVLSELEPTDLQDGSSFGRAYCKSGGVAASVAQAVKEMGREDFEVKPVICNGIEECRAALMKAKAGKLGGNISLQLIGARVLFEEFDSSPIVICRLCYDSVG